MFFCIYLQICFVRIFRPSQEQSSWKPNSMCLMLNGEHSVISYVIGTIKTIRIVGEDYAIAPLLSPMPFHVK